MRQKLQVSGAIGRSGPQVVNRLTPSGMQRAVAAGAAATSMKLLMDSRPASGSAAGMRVLSMFPECRQLRRYTIRRLYAASTLAMRSNSAVSPSM